MFNKISTLKATVLFIFLFILSSSSLFSKQLDLANETNIDAYKYISYIKDDNFTLNTLRFEEFKSLSKAHLGNQIGPFWTKLEITNSSNIDKDIVIFNALAGTNSIEVQILKNGKLYKNISLGDFVPQSKIEFLSRYPSFHLIINPTDTYTIVSKIENYSIYNLSWNINEYSYFYNTEITRSIKFGLLQGLGLFFIIICLISYYTYRNKLYILLGLITVSMMSYQLGFHGIIYYLNTGLNLNLITTITWNSSIIGAFFIVMFAYYLFEVENNFKKIAYSLKLIMLIFAIIILGTFYAQYFDNSFFNYSWILGLVIIVSTIYLFVLSIYFVYKKQTSAKYYFYAESIFLVALLLNTLGLFNYIEYKENYKFLIPFAHLISYVVYMLALNAKNRKEYQELRGAKQILMEKYRFNSIEQAIGNITHQWKHPLTKIGTTFALLEVTYKHNKSNFDNIFLEKTKSINNSIELMKKIIDEFSNNINKVSVTNEFNIKDTIVKCADILDTPITLHNIELNLDIDEKLTIKSDEYLIMNILLVFLNNSIDAFKSNNTETKKIDIIFSENNGQKLLIYKDNAGGINLKNINDIFDYLVSTKKEQDGKGIGLAIVKMLVTEKLHGNIDVKNIDKGCEFTIQF